MKANKFVFVVSVFYTLVVGLVIFVCYQRSSVYDVNAQHHQYEIIPPPYFANSCGSETFEGSTAPRFDYSVSSSDIRIRKITQLTFIDGLRRAIPEPLSMPDAAYIGTDSGWYLKVSPSGKVLWKYMQTSSPHGRFSNTIRYGNCVIVAQSNGLILAFNDDSGSIAWAVKVALRLGSSILYRNGQIFGVAATELGQRGFLVGVDASNGAILWQSKLIRQPVGGNPMLGQLSDTSSTEDMAIVQVPNKGLRAYSLATRYRRWSSDDRSLGDEVSLAVADNLVISVDRGRVVFRDLKLGSQVGQYTLSSKSPAAFAFAKGERILYIAQGDGSLSALDVAGKGILWSVSGAGSSYVAAKPLIISMNQQPTIVTRCLDRFVCLVDMASGELKQKVFVDTIPIGFAATGQGLFVIGNRNDGLIELEFDNNSNPDGNLTATFDQILRLAWFS